jgi:hypothetical protein
VAALPWIAGAFAVAAVAGSLAFLVVRTIRVWRGFRSFGGPIAEALAGVTASADAAAAKAEALGGGSERMARSLDRLARSRARLAVLTLAIAEVRAAVTGIVPRK